MVDAALYSSKKSTWGTPADLFLRQHRKFKFTVDGAAHAKNKKLDRYWGPGSSECEDSLSRSWEGERVYLNPPYGRGLTFKWVRKAYEEGQKENTLVACLLPARTCTAWWHKFVKRSYMIIFVEGRVWFEGSTAGAPFPSVIVIFKKHGNKYPKIRHTISHKSEKLSKDERAKIVRMIDKGFSNRKIMRKTGRTTKTVGMARASVLKKEKEKLKNNAE